MTQILKLSCASFSYVNISYVLAKKRYALLILTEGASKVHTIDILITSLLGYKQTVAPPLDCSSG